LCIATVLDKLLDKLGVTTLIHGGARGADSLAAEWAMANGIPVLEYPVTPEDWRTIGKAAGPMRNQRMLDEGKPDLVVAFPGGSGTADMVRRAQRAGVKVINECGWDWFGGHEE
jgi:hypothetical protein